MRRGPLLLLLLALLAAAVAPRPAPAGIAPLLDLRVRQEVLDGVIHFAPEPDRNWIRVRTRGGAAWTAGAHRLALRAVNEHRHHLHPDARGDLDELVIDRALWAWQATDALRVTLGRQDLVWPGGFLVLDAHPLDGSRTIAPTALRLQTSHGGLAGDLAVVRNLKRDPWVLAGDEHRALSDADESALAARLVRGAWQAGLVLKRERDPDGVLPERRDLTVGLRYDVPRLEAELALQRQDVDAPSGGGVLAGDDAGGAMAAQAFWRGPVGRGWRAEAGGFYYSGDPDGRHAFRTPWGRWPKWSELYIYTLVGESTPGRVAAAAWENVAAPRLQLRRDLAPGRALRLGATWLLAPEPRWLGRGLLTQAEFTLRLPGAVSGHLLWEMLAPGPFHDGRYGLPPLTDTVHFLRWQLSWTL